MTGILLILALAMFALLYTPKNTDDKESKLPPKLADQLDRMWDIAQKSFSEEKFLRAEKALLTILKFDEANAQAYNRLGILYARQKKYDESIECFEIAQSLDSNANSLHNVGLIYLETGEAEKASMAFEQALALENDLPTRYIAYSKALEAIGDYKKAIAALESSLELNKSVQVYRQLAHLYEASGDHESADKIKTTLDKLAARRQVANPIKTAGAAIKARTASKRKRVM
jgi:tetratricopeptide (TPR) repeat protein